MSIEPTIEELLKEWLGSTSDGPGLFFEEGKFVVCHLDTDSPVEPGIGNTIDEAIINWMFNQ